MQFISSSDAKQSFGAAIDAAQRAPIVIRRQNRDVAVLLSVAEFNKLRGLRLDVLDRISSEIAAEAKSRGFSEADLEALIADVS